ncbi:macrophage mannose receptor 1-like [Penaeus monodon]|uniref:macrophage mannose receptor 1-like n=1 Tax=Penaeus monodon TaxID=6687 RepID=UPI0018A74444|nr:macrophage mannose receptor 1-like [Penaeus monodon]
MLFHLLLISTCSLFVGEADGRVTWNRTTLESFQAEVELMWNRTDLTLGSQDCPGGYTLVGTKCLMFVTFAAEPYQEARFFCHTVRGELAAITTATDLKILVDYIHANGFFGRTFWLDGTLVEDYIWLTSSGKFVPMSTPFWGTFEYTQLPDNVDWNEYCLSLSSDYFFYFNDLPCYTTTNFICEATIQNEAASAALAPFGPSAVGGRVACPMLFVEVGGLCMMFVTWAEETWYEAWQTCAGASSDLLAITDIEVLRALYIFIEGNNFYEHTFWLGGSDIENEWTWVYTTGEPVPMGTPFWGLTDMSAPSQEPNGGTSENCLAIGGFYNFRDYSCGSRFNPLCVYTG